MLAHLKNKTEQRKKYVLNKQHISAIRDYFSNYSTTCDFPELPDELWELKPKEVASYKQQLKELFVVPRLKEQNLNHKYKCQLIEAFLTFLLQLLYHNKKYSKPTWVENLEQELRCLHTILGDVSWMLVDCDEMKSSDELHNLMAKFESTTNQAGYFLHSKLIGTDIVEFQEMDDCLSAVLHSVGLLKACLHSSGIITTPLCTTPKTGFINSFLFLDSLVNDLEDLLKRKDNPISEVKDQTILLHQGLQFLHSSIKEMRSPQPSEIGELRELVMHIGDIADQAQYLITAFLVKDLPIWYVITRLTNLNHKIHDISKEFQVIRETYKFGGLKLTEYNPTQVSPIDVEGKKDSNGIIVGFEDEERDILNELEGGTHRQLIISIVGMPGLGKTTLAKKLFNHPLVRYKFDKLSWCVISQAYERRTILAEILIRINNDFDKDEILEMEDETLGEHIYKTLKGRRYFVAMDDVWDSDVLYELRRFFPDDGNGSRILVTSRIKDVAPPDSIIHELPFLSDEQCWELLQKKAFCSRTCPPLLQPIGKQIAAKCHGLPLTVSVLAGVLSTMEEDESTWEEVLGNLASYVKDSEENAVMQILELSYKHLPDHLKPCFLFFGAYKEDEEVFVGELKRFWVAEGFTQREYEKSEESVAEEYLMELINRSLVMVAERKIDGKVKACVVHDLLRDLCLKIFQEESFLQFWNNESYTIFEK